MNLLMGTTMNILLRKKKSIAFFCLKKTSYHGHRKVKSQFNNIVYVFILVCVSQWS